MVIKKFSPRKVLFICTGTAILGVLMWPLFLFSSEYTYIPDMGSQQYFTIEMEIEPETKPFVHNATNEHVNATSLFSSITAPLQHKTTLMSTKTCVQDYFLLILVSSAAPNIERRRDIRQTWGVDTALKPRWKTVFLVAHSRVQNVSESLLKEDDAFGDLVRADYYDDYWNQTLKIQMGFEWAARYCKFSYVLKMDDDTFVDSKGLISVLNEPKTPRERLYMGRLWRHAGVHRHKGDKWAVSKEEYSKTVYPDFCAGFGFILSAVVLHLFVDLFDVVPAFKIDDVYIGILADRAGVSGTDHPGFKQYPSPPRIPCNRDPKILVWHDITGECLFKLFRLSF